MDDRQTLIPHVVAEVFVIPALVAGFAGVVTAQGTFLGEPEVGELGRGPARKAV